MANFTEKALKETFLKMLEEKPLSQITIKALVEECGINRNSFYYHFHDLPELIESIVMDEADRVIEENPNVESVEEAFNLLIEFSMLNRRAVLHIYNSVNRDIFESYLRKMCDYAIGKYCEVALADVDIADNDKELLRLLLTFECFGAVLIWLSDGMKEEDIEALQNLFKRARGISDNMFQFGNDN